MTAPDEGDPGDPDAILPSLDSRDFPPPSARVSATFGAQSRRGRMRTVNEDHYLVLRLGRHQETLLTSLPDDAVAARFDGGAQTLVGSGRRQPDVDDGDVDVVPPELASQRRLVGHRSDHLDPVPVEEADQAFS